MKIFKNRISRKNVKKRDNQTSTTPSLCLGLMTDFKLEDRFSPTKLSYKNSESSLVGKNFTNIRRRAGHNVSVFLPGTKPIEINGSAHNDDHLSV